MSMNALIARFNALSLRERVMIALTALVLAYGTFEISILSGQRAMHRQLSNALNDVTNKSSIEHARLGALVKELGEQGAASGWRASEALSAEIARLDERIASTARSVITPTQMVAVLREMFAGDRSVQLTALENMPPTQPLNGSDFSGNAVSPIYRHALAIEFKGDYGTIVGYLKRLEGLDWNLGWEDFSIVMEDYPSARARVVLYTLSLDKDWIGA